MHNTSKQEPRINPTGLCHNSAYILICTHHYHKDTHMYIKGNTSKIAGKSLINAADLYGHRDRYEHVHFNETF